MARRLGEAFAGVGVTVVGGMARGCDTAAHTGALNGGGRTVAVLGCGIRVLYPHENVDLARRIFNSGAVISEHVGVREWIDFVEIAPNTRVATFDTSIPSWFRLGTAARAAAKALRGRGARTTVGPSFYVTGMEGPLADGELGRATAWGRELAAKARTQTVEE